MKILGVLLGASLTLVYIVSADGCFEGSVSDTEAMSIYGGADCGTYYVDSAMTFCSSCTTTHFGWKTQGTGTSTYGKPPEFQTCRADGTCGGGNLALPDCNSGS